MGVDHRRGDRSGRRDPLVLLNLAVLGGVVLAYLANELWLTPRIDGVFAEWYLNDVLAGLFLLAWTNFLIALSPWRARRITTLLPSLALTLSAGLFWELVTPLYRASMADLRDLVAYCSGGALYVGIGAFIRLGGEPRRAP